LLLNTRFLLTTRELEHAELDLVYDDEICLYRYLSERPRAFLVHTAESVESRNEAIRRLASGTVDPSVTVVVEAPDHVLDHLPQDGAESTGTVGIVHYRHGEVELMTSIEKPTMIVLFDVMYPGWRAVVKPLF